MLKDCLCKVKDLSTFKTKSGLDYKILTVEVLPDSKKGIDRSSPIIARRCLWPERNVRLYDTHLKLFYERKYKADTFYNIRSQYIECNVVSVQTTPYKHEGEEMTSFIGIVYEDDFLKEISKQLKYLGIDAIPIDSNGKKYFYESAIIEIDENNNQKKY